MNPEKTKQHLLAGLAAVLTSGAILSATASPVIVPDFSFEKTIIADGASAGALNVGTNWSAAGNTAAILGGVYLMNPTNEIFAGTTGDLSPLPAPADGTNCLFMSLGTFKSYAWQDIGVLQSNTTYTLTVAVGASLFGNSGVGKIALVNGVNPFGSVLAATVVDSSLITPGSFANSNVVFTTGQHVSGHLTIVLEGDSGTELIFDNVRLDATATPQAPTTFVPTASPSNTVYVGTSTVTLSEDPAGALPLSYQWQTDNGSGGATFSSISGATSASYAANVIGFTPNSPVLFRVIVTNSFGASTSAPVAITVIAGQPSVTMDTLPASGSDVVGSAVTFTAAFTGNLPISYQWQRDGSDIPGATSTSLTLTNLQLTDTGGYSLRASNALGMAFSTSSQFTVNPVPDPVSGVVTSIATQTGYGTDALFTPTWAVSTNDLVAGVAPSNVGAGNFAADGWGSIADLTDSKVGRLNSPGNGSPDFVTAGINNGAATFGPSVTYTLPGSTTGYDLTNIVVYGGWSDAGHDQQKYTVLYSTIASPGTFNQLTGVDFNPTLAGTVQSATRITITATNGVLARNVAAVKFDFNILQPPVVEGGYAGYSEIVLSGVASPHIVVLATNISPLGGSDVVGSTVTFTAAFSSETPITYQWRVDKGSGPVNIPNATNTTLTLTNLQLTDSGSYSLQASNAAGAAVTSSSAFVVNPVPPPDGNGVIASPANQYGAAPFATTWAVNSGSLIAGQLPTSVGDGRFTREGAIGAPVLTDGTFGTVGGGITSTATAGNGNGGCTSAIYTLATGSSSGYSISNITVYAGWNDGGRDQQAYALRYSTVNAPDSFIDLTLVNYNPTVPGSTPTADRVTITSATGAALATNVARVQFDWSVPGTENGYAGYTEIGIFGAASPVVSYAPFIRSDITPTTCSDVVGSSVTFKASFTANPTADYRWKKDGSYIPGATTTALTLINLQAADLGSYSLEASNALGIAESTASTLTAVNPVPAPVNNIIASIAAQTGVGNGRLFDPTWAIAPGSLIAGQLPSSTAGNFVNLDGNGGSTGGTGVLTDGKFDQINTPGGASRSLAAGGNAQGQTATYTLAGSPTGYDLTNIVVYGGWSDGGRDAQSYTIYYSTVSAPTTFIQLRNLSSNPSLPGAVQSAQRVTFTSSTAGPIATSVAAVKFDFTTPAPENGWTGYGEIGVFGVASATVTPLTINSTRASGGNLILTGAGGTPNGSYAWLSSTNVASPLATWTTNTTGSFNGSGAFSNAIPINTGEALRFFRLKTP
jgi:hypothetical protein